MRRFWTQAVAMLGILALASSASADGDYARFNDPIRVYVGGFWPTINSEIGINSDVLPPGPPVDVEDVLGVADSKGVVWGGIGWHFANRHSLEFEHFSLERTAEKSDTFSPPVQIGDIFIEAGSISTAYDTSLSRLTYGFSIIRNERSDFQLKAGLHVGNLEARIGLAGLICGPTTVPTEPPGCPAAGTGTAKEDVATPLPHFGASYAYSMTPTLAFNLKAIGFAIEIDSIEGSIFEFDADIAWQPWRHFGFGAGVRYFNTNVKAANSELDGEFSFEYLGPTLYIHGTF